LVVDSVDRRVEEQLKALGHELARAEQLFARGTLTTSRTSTAEAQVEHIALKTAAVGSRAGICRQWRLHP
jgi:hypothetical protein